MASPSRPRTDGPVRPRLTPRAPDTPASDDRADTGRNDAAGSGGDNLVGTRERGSPASRRTTDTGSRDAGGRADPIGSALASARGRQRNAPDAAAGSANTAGSGPHSLGAATGGERASAGRADADRSSRDDDDSREA